ncbi:MAG: putative transcriptional regulator [Pseudohongiellaceae bacterium]|jgi:predicted transcriptional regulator
MKNISVGIMPPDQFRQRTLDIAAGKYKPKAREPKVWFSSMKSLSEVLSDKNILLLQLIARKQPASIKELADLSGRQSSNLSRTLKTFESYGFVQMQEHQASRAKRPVVQATGFTIQTPAL